MPTPNDAAIIASQKAEIKADIKYMLNRLVAMIETDKEKYSALVSDICNDLNSTTKDENGKKDKYSLIECLVIRHAIFEQLKSVMSSKNAKTAIKANVTNLRYVSDPTGGFHVIGTEDGVEKIVFQTDNEQKAKDFVSHQGVIAAPAEDPEGFDDIPSEGFDPDADVDTDIPSEENFGMEEDTDFDNLNNRYDEINDLGTKLLGDIDNGIQEVTQLQAVTDLAEIRVEIEDTLDELSRISLNDSQAGDSNDFETAIADAEEKLHNLETQAIDIIGKYVPGSESETMGTDAENDVAEAVESAEVQEDEDANQQNREIDRMDANNDELPTYSRQQTEEAINETAEELDRQESAQNSAPESTQSAQPNQQEQVSPIDNIDDVDFSDTNFDETEFDANNDDFDTGDFNQLLDELMSNVIVPGDKVEAVAEVKSKLQNAATEPAPVVTKNNNIDEQIEDKMISDKQKNVNPAADAVQESESIIDSSDECYEGNEILASKKKKSNSKNGLLVKKATVDNLFEEGDQVSNYIGASKEKDEDCDDCEGDDCEGIDSCDNENADCDDKEPILGRDPENGNQSKRLAKRRRYRKSNTDATLGCDASEF